MEEYNIIKNKKKILLNKIGSRRNKMKNIKNIL